MHLRQLLPSLTGLLLLGAAPFAAATASPMTAEKIIAELKMAKIPDEGAWFAVTYESADRIPAAALPSRYGSSRLAGTAIYALVTRTDFSAMHRLKTDEVWLFHAGEPIELLLLHPDGSSEVVLLGTDLLAGQRPQHVVRAGTWMGARPLGAKPDAYSLFGCTLAPGFDYADYEPGYREELAAAFPARAALIVELTREEFVRRPPAAETSSKAPPPAVPNPFTPEDVPAVTVAPGVELRELIGRVAATRTSDYSVARFALSPGKSTGTSYNKIGEEVFLVIAGRGVVTLGSETSSVAAGSVVVIKPGVRHSLAAAPGESLDFYAITFPAFSPDDYVRVD